MTCVINLEREESVFILTMDAGVLERLLPGMHEESALWEDIVRRVSRGLFDGSIETPSECSHKRSHTTGTPTDGNMKLGPRPIVHHPDTGT